MRRLTWRSKKPSSPTSPPSTEVELWNPYRPSEDEQSPWSAPLTEPELAVQNSLSWYTSMHLTVITQKEVENGVDLLEKLAIMSDRYEGSIFMKPIILLLYASAGVNLKPIARRQDGFHYAVELDELMSYTISGGNYQGTECNIDWFKVLGQGPNRITIRFKLKMIPSRRKGRPFFQYYSKDSTANDKPGLDILKEMFMIDNVEITNGDAVFN
ncbi:matrix protein [Wuhan Insect virus 7]|uniref:matrix protein n=1 Tax=Wuhan Insect virus 7 TaxID=1608112 RepID=UPI0005AD4B6B|nr:matrix protein [Wuhan Insect virus 7]AJG39194.1 matrix protein [Wuhan Insect virus 7]